MLRGLVNYTLPNDTAPYLTGGVYTKGKVGFSNGRLEIRAKLHGATGAWPAFWTLGSGCEYGGMRWPECGEIDIMEYYPHMGVPSVLANVGWYNGDYLQAEWSSKTVTMDALLEKDPQWKEKFHIWTMEWEMDAPTTSQRSIQTTSIHIRTSRTTPCLRVLPRHGGLSTLLFHSLTTRLITSRQNVHPTCLNLPK